MFNPLPLVLLFGYEGPQPKVYILTTIVMILLQHVAPYDRRIYQKPFSGAAHDVLENLPHGR